MAFTDQQVLQWFLDNPNATDAQIATTAAAAGVSAEQISRVTSVPVAQVEARVAAAAPTVQLPSSSASSGLFSTAAPVSTVSQPTNSDVFSAPSSNNTLGGVILAGDSWLAGTENTQRISQQLGQPVTNVAVGGFTTQDTINQLNSFIQGGGKFAPNSTIMLDIGGNDLLQNVNPQVVKNNLQQLVSTLANNNVKVVLSGAPNVNSVSGITGSTNLKINDIFKDVAKNNSNVTLVDSMSGLLNQKNLVDETGFHLNDAGQTAFTAALSNAYLQSQGLPPVKYSEQAIKDFAVNNNLSLDQALALAPSFSLSQDSIRKAFAGGSSWDYNKYVEGLKTGNADFNQEFDKLDGLMGQNAKNIYREILAQQNAGSKDFWYAGNTASPEAAAADFALRLAENGIGSLSQLGQATIKDPTFEQPDQQITINKATGEPLPRPELLGRGTRGLDIDYNLSFAADGTVIPFTSNRQSSWMNFRENTLKPVAAFALATVGAPLIGAAVAPGLSLATQGAIGGAIAGGASAALTDGNVLQGALLGGAGGYLQGANAVPAQDSIYSLANGTPNLNYMGGGQGLTSTGAANLASMGGAQGLQILAGLPSETLAEALRTFGGVNPSALSSMGLGTGITYVTPSGIVTENGTIIGGDIISELGKNTGFNLPNWLNENVGVGIGDTLAKVDTGVNSGLFSGVTPTTPPSTTTPTTPTTSLPPIPPGVIGGLVKAGAGLLTTGAVATAAGSGANVPMQAPTQGVPTNDANYYNQLQQYYNAYLPQTPRDVVTPLQQWYNSQSGA